MRLRDIINGLLKVWQDPNKPNTTTIYSNNLARNYPLRWNKSQNTATITNVTTNIDLTVFKDPNSPYNEYIKINISELDIMIIGTVLGPEKIWWRTSPDILGPG